ncbi:MAG: outer membrane protein transport protein, partial [Thermonemataceae bacterium]|nr:outer membrane protein transport protein [Thermonemataceae bacterium]
TNGAIADSELDGKAKGFGWNVGVVVKPVDKLQIGLAYRAKVDAKVEDGTATFSNIPMLADPAIPGTPGQQLAATFPNLSNGTSTTKFNVTLPLPAVATLGISWLPSENLTINAEARYTFWSAYEELRFDFKEAVAGSTVSASPRNYADRVTYGLGAEYKIKDLAIRAGGYYDPTPVKNGYMTAETPDADTFAGTLGFGYTINKKISIDFGSIFLSKEKRSNNIPESNTEGDLVGPSGTYKTNSFVGTLGVSFIF